MGDIKTFGSLKSGEYIYIPTPKGISTRVVSTVYKGIKGIPLNECIVEYFKLGQLEADLISKVIDTSDHNKADDIKKIRVRVPLNSESAVLTKNNQLTLVVIFTSPEALQAFMIKSTLVKTFQKNREKLLNKKD